MCAAAVALDPVLIEVPERIETDRLLLRCPRRGDGAVLHAAVAGTFEWLRLWMPWVQGAQTAEDAEAYCRRQAARFLLREDLVYFVFGRRTAGSEAPLLGAAGLHRIDWRARRFEIGYWRRHGCGGLGVMTEAVLAVNRLAFDGLGACRVEARMDGGNERSWRLAERAGFTFEGLLRSDAATAEGAARSTRVYARVRGVEE